MEETAMRRGDQRLSVQGFGEGDGIEEKVDGMDMDDIGFAYGVQKARGYRISPGSEPRQPDHGQAVNRFALRQPIGEIAEDAVEGDDLNVGPVCKIFRKMVHGLFEAANAWPELADDMDDVHGYDLWWS
ncbi:hypothetical protein IZ6_26560 [Terrihabitans soli]|uniref:Uncharacterized protein n=1 Tax=Terrihabitans soli TaxID=708113 RepID=A0A6S6QY16_9HYPH|nr:hypothetical protein IZ6_26560 [Terrihabitans soli]